LKNLMGPSLTAIVMQPINRGGNRLRRVDAASSVILPQVTFGALFRACRGGALQQETKHETTDQKRPSD
jgi:hypothetical protein